MLESVEELKKAGYDLDEAFKLAVLAEGEKSLAILGDTSDLAATKIGILESQISDSKTILAEYTIGLLAGTDGKVDLANKTQSLVDWLSKEGEEHQNEHRVHWDFQAPKVQEPNDSIAL